jgi:hypothetical protein
MLDRTCVVVVEKVLFCFVRYFLNKSLGRGISNYSIPNTLAWAREKIHPVFHIFATRHKQNTPILDHNTPLKAGVLPMVFVSWYIFNREDFVEKNFHLDGISNFSCTCCRKIPSYIPSSFLVVWVCMSRYERTLTNTTSFSPHDGVFFNDGDVMPQ